MEYLFDTNETTLSKVKDISLCPIKPGQYFICTDTGDIYYDTKDGVRKHLTDIIDLETDEERLAILAPIDKVYFVKSTRHFYRFILDEWVDLSANLSSIGNSTVVSKNEPVGQNTNDEWLEIISIE